MFKIKCMTQTLRLEVRAIRSVQITFILCKNLLFLCLTKPSRLTHCPDNQVVISIVLRQCTEANEQLVNIRSLQKMCYVRSLRLR